MSMRCGIGSVIIRCSNFAKCKYEVHSEEIRF